MNSIPPRRINMTRRVAAGGNSACGMEVARFPKDLKFYHVRRFSFIGIRFYSLITQRMV
jgi:hypothetical protein